MPIKIPDSLPARATLEGENIFVMTEYRALHQDIRPLKVLILNQMCIRDSCWTPPPPSPRFRPPVWRFMSIISPFTPNTRSAPVSYTHLDVYKRQPSISS